MEPGQTTSALSVICWLRRIKWIKPVSNPYCLMLWVNPPVFGQPYCGTPALF